MRELFAQRVNEQLARLDHHVDRLAVELERYRLLLRHVLLLESTSAARERAVRSARCVISPAIAVLYSASPRWSAARVADAHREVGGLRDRRIGQRLPPQRVFRRARLERRRADVGQRDRDRANRLARHRERDGGGRRREIADLALQLRVAVAGAGRRHGDADLRHDLVGLQQRVVGADEEAVGRHDPLARAASEHERRAERQHQRRVIVAGVAVGNVAADRSLVAHLRIGNEPRALDQQRALLLQELRPDELVLGGHRADADRASALADALELGNLAEVDQMARLREAHLHHRQQAVTAGEQLRLVAELLQQAERVGNGSWRVILEFARNHRILLQRSSWSAILAQRTATKQAHAEPVGGRRAAGQPSVELTVSRRRQFELPARALRERLQVLHRVEVRDEAGIGRLVHVDELGLGGRSGGGRRGSCRSRESGRARPRRGRSDCRAVPFTTGTTTCPAGRFLNAPISSVRSPAPINGWSAGATMTASNGPLERGEARADGALLSVGVRFVVRQRHDEAAHLVLDRVARVPGDDDHLVDSGAAQGDQLPADERHALQADQRLGHAAHPPALAGRQEHRADAQPRMNPALLEQASHGRGPAVVNATKRSAMRTHHPTVLRPI